jgi:hypothetical protein
VSSFAAHADLCADERLPLVERSADGVRSTGSLRLDRNPPGRSLPKLCVDSICMWSILEGARMAEVVSTDE